MPSTSASHKKPVNLFDPPKTAYINEGLDGVNDNAYAIIGHFRKAALNQDWSAKDVATVLNEAQSDDYDYLRATILKHIQSD